MKELKKMSKLKPCPFCGANVIKLIAPKGTVMFICNNCGADVCFFGAEREPKATKSWNERFGEVKKDDTL